MHARNRPCALATLATAVVVLASVTSASGQTTDEAKPKSTPSQQIIQGCLMGAVISSIEVDELSAPLELPPGATLRLAGSKDVVRSLKKDHNGHLLELSGKLKGSFGPPTPTHSIGGVTVGISGSPTASGPNTPAVPSMPSFEVKAFKLIGDCSTPR